MSAEADVAGGRTEPTATVAAALVVAYAAVAVAGMASRAPDALVVLASVVLAAGLLSASVIDAMSYRLPDPINATLAIAGLVFGALSGWALAAQLASGAIGFAALWIVGEAYRRLRGRDGIGLGDAKLLGVAGIWLGVEALPTVLLAAAVGALVWVLIRAVLRQTAPGGEWIAFGPFLAGGIWLVWTHGAA